MKKIIIFVSTFIVCISCIIFPFCACSDNKPTKPTTPTYYINETMPYEEIDITVNSVKCIKNNNTESDYYGLFDLTISFTLKNNKTKDFHFNFNDINIKTQDKGEKYDYTPSIENLGSIFLGETIIAGASKTYNISFYVPYSLEEKKYIMCFDWGVLYKEQEYYLYLRDGTNPSYEDDTTRIEALTDLRNLIYTTFKEYVYNQITGTMYYSDVQRLIDSTLRQCKSACSYLDYYLNLSNGVYYPKWIVYATVDKKYPLIYIEVELTTAYKISHKFMGYYDIV